MTDQEVRRPRRPRSVGDANADETKPVSQPENTTTRQPRQRTRPRTRSEVSNRSPRRSRHQDTAPSASAAPSEPTKTAVASDFNPLLDENDALEEVSPDSADGLEESSRERSDDSVSNDNTSPDDAGVQLADELLTGADDVGDAFNPVLDEDVVDADGVVDSADTDFNPVLDEDENDHDWKHNHALNGASNKGLVSVDDARQQSDEKLKATIREHDLDPYAHNRKERSGRRKPGPKPNPNSKSQQKKRLSEENRALIRKHEAEKKAAREAGRTPEEKQEAWNKLTPEVKEQVEKVRQHAADGTTPPIASRKKKTDKKYRRRDLTDKDYQILTSIALGGLLTANSAFNGLFPPGTERGNATSTVRKRLLGLAELGVISHFRFPGSNFYVLTNKGATALEAGVDFPAEQAWVLSPEKVMGHKAKHWIAYSSYVSRLVGQHGISVAERGDSSFFISEYSLLRDLNREYSDPSAKSRTLSRKVIAGGLNRDFNELVSIEKKHGRAAAREHLVANPRLFVLFHFDPLHPENSRTKFPDGVYYDATRDEFVAIEIETTGKTKNDYEDLFGMYNQSIGKVFDRVHYICSENNIVNTIQRSKSAKQLRGRGETKRLTVEKLHSWEKSETNNIMDVWAL